MGGGAPSLGECMAAALGEHAEGSSAAAGGAPGSRSGPVGSRAGPPAGEPGPTCLEAEAGLVLLAGERGPRLPENTALRCSCAYLRSGGAVWLGKGGCGDAHMSALLNALSCLPCDAKAVACWVRCGPA